MEAIVKLKDEQAQHLQQFEQALQDANTKLQEWQQKVQLFTTAIEYAKVRIKAFEDALGVQFGVQSPSQPAQAGAGAPAAATEAPTSTRATVAAKLGADKASVQGTEVGARRLGRRTPAPAPVAPTGGDDAK